MAPAQRFARLAPIVRRAKNALLGMAVEFHHLRKITATAAMIKAKPAKSFQPSGCLRYRTENTENTVRGMTSCIVFHCAAVNS